MILKRDVFAPVTDLGLRARVWRNLKNSAVLECPPDLRIVASSGVVRLEGSVSFPAEKTMIEEIARMTEGVIAVENALRITPFRIDSADRPLGGDCLNRWRRSK